MQSRIVRRLPLVVVLVLTGAFWGLGAGWGLPSRAIDPFLFGDRPAWTGEQVLELGGAWQLKPTQGSDHPRSAPQKADQARELNDSDVGRAELILRYRLYSFHPDEMYTFRALSLMRPGSGNFDPRMYHYGGLWFYPVGALLKVGSLCGVVHVTSNVGYYIEHPEAFGRFYLLVRLYVMAGGLLGAWAVYRIVQKLCSGWAAPVCAVACFALLPVVVELAHEVKPHLPGMTLVLLAVLAAGAYVQAGTRRSAVRAG